MKRTQKFDRERLRKIVESYGGSLRAFEELRPDCYEQAVAAHSLEQLDLLYSEIFAPGLSLWKVREICPPWPPGSAHGGQPPKEKVLRGIFERFQTDRQTERVLRLVREAKDLMALFRRAVKMLAPDVRTEDLDAVIALLAQEIVKGKLDGIPVSDQLPAVDRLLAREKLAQKTDEVKLKEEQLKLEEKRQQALEKRIAEAAKAAKAEGKPGAITKEAWEELERDLRLI